MWLSFASPRRRIHQRLHLCRLRADHAAIRYHRDGPHLRRHFRGDRNERPLGDALGTAASASSPPMARTVVSGAHRRLRHRGVVRLLKGFLVAKLNIPSLVSPSAPPSLSGLELV